MTSTTASTTASAAPTSRLGPATQTGSAAPPSSASATKTALVTGCSSGIGRATAHHFARQGWRVAATLRNPADAGDLDGLPQVAVLRLDVTDTASIAQAVDTALGRFGRIDALVNNAGFGAFGPFETASPDLIERQLATNLVGVMNVVRAVLPTLRAQGDGDIVNIASIGGLVTLPFNAIYHATKFAVVGFTEALAYELRPFGIRPKYVAPGGVATDFAGRSLATTFEGDDHPYAGAVKRVMAKFEDSGGAYSQPEAIAAAIFAAVEDRTGRIRFVAGADAESLLEQRTALGDQQFVAMVSERYGL